MPTEKEKRSIHKYFANKPTNSQTQSNQSPLPKLVLVAGAVGWAEFGF